MYDLDVFLFLTLALVLLGGNVFVCTILVKSLVTAIGLCSSLLEFMIKWLELLVVEPLETSE